MRSGYYAAKSIIDGEDFYKLCQHDLFPKMKAATVNRLVFAIFGNRAYKWLAKRYLGKDPIKFMRGLYDYPWYKKILFPASAVILKKNIKDPRDL